MLPEAVAPSTESSFLTTLAGQERRVLELREDLRRAEEELDRLKKHWAKHELNKKGHEPRRSVQLQPIKTNFAVSTPTQSQEPEDAQQKLQRELDRRRALASATRQSNRRMFSGSRHTRTLSLLSPDKGSELPNFTDSPFKKPAARIPIERAATTPELQPVPHSPTKEDLFADLTGVPREAILRTGKQMVGDIKDGFWTFVEDIRQAAVGNEAVDGPPSARMSSAGPAARPAVARSKSQRVPSTHDKKLARHSTALITSTQPKASSPKMAYDSPSPELGGGSFWRENGVNSPESTRSRSTGNTIRPASATPLSSLDRQKDGDEGWDMWGTPIRLGTKHATSNSISSTNTNATRHAHRRSTSPSSATSECDLASKTGALSSTGPSSPTTNTTLSTPDMAALCEVSSPRDSVWPKQLAKMVDPRSIQQTASSLLPDWERALNAEDPKKPEKQD
jgi:Domain of unknown function (DUF4048)